MASLCPLCFLSCAFLRFVRVSAPSYDSQRVPAQFPRESERGRNPGFTLGLGPYSVLRVCFVFRGAFLHVSMSVGPGRSGIAIRTDR
jgi:hypothetical protein